MKTFVKLYQEVILFNRIVRTLLPLMYAVNYLWREKNAKKSANKNLLWINYLKKRKKVRKELWIKNKWIAEQILNKQMKTDNNHRQTLDTSC